MATTATSASNRPNSTSDWAASYRECTNTIPSCSETNRVAGGARVHNGLFVTPQPGEFSVRSLQPGEGEP
jgi:hypothetical protein